MVLLVKLRLILGWATLWFSWGVSYASWTLSCILSDSLPVLSVTMANIVGRLCLTCVDFSPWTNAEYLWTSALWFYQHVLFLPLPLKVQLRSGEELTPHREPLNQWQWVGSSERERLSVALPRVKVGWNLTWPWWWPNSIHLYWLLFPVSLYVVLHSYFLGSPSTICM